MEKVTDSPDELRKKLGGLEDSSRELFEQKGEFESGTIELLYRDLSFIEDKIREIKGTLAAGLNRDTNKTEQRQ